jgi:hypothetical protein
MEELPMILRLCVFATSIFFVACGVQEDKSSERSSGSSDAVEGSFLDPTEFALSATLEIDEAGAKKSVGNNFFFQNQEPAPGESGLDKYVKDCSTLTDSIEATPNSLRVTYNSDNQDCSEETNTNSKMQVFVELGCDGTDLSVEDGAKASDLVLKDRWRFCPEDSQQTLVFNMQIQLSGDIEGGSAVVVSKGGLMSSTGGPCRYDVADDRVTVGDCGFYLMASYDSTVDGETTTTVATKQIFKGSGLKGPANGWYYDEGTTAIETNNWTGEMTYSSENNPEFVLSNGSEEISDTFYGSFSLKGPNEFSGLIEKVLEGVGQ